MNPTDLQRRLDAVAIDTAPDPASEADWDRNVELVRTRTRRRRAGRTVVAGLAVAATVAVALVWNPPSDTARIEPAGPQRSSGRVLAPQDLLTLAQDCTADVRRVEDVTPLFAVRGGHVDGVLYRYDDGGLRFCASFDGAARTNTPVSSSGPVTGENGRSAVSAATYGEDLEMAFSAFGFLPAGATRVVVSPPDGREVEAVLSGGYWWATGTLAEDENPGDVTWRALDAGGVVLEEGGGLDAPAPGTPPTPAPPS